MHTGNKTPGRDRKYAGKRRFSALALVISALVLSFAAIGGTAAWLADDTGPLENTLTMPQTDIEILEDFDGSVKQNVRVKNTGDVPVYVRVSFVINYQDAEGNVAPQEPDPLDYEVRLSASGDWFPCGNGIFYCRLPLAPGAVTGNLVDSVTMKENADVPQGFTLSFQVLAQSVQAQGMQDGVPMVEARGWPVTVQDDGTLAQN